MSESRFYRDTSDGINETSNTFTNSKSGCSIGSIAYHEFNLSTIWENRHSIFYTTKSASLFRKDMGSETIIGITQSDLRDVKVTKKVSSTDPKSQCSTIQKFFLSHGINDSTALATMCSTTPREIEKSLSDNGHTVEYRKTR